jgi:hypothetical protein
MFQLGGHSHDHRTEGVAGGAEGIGGLLGVSSLPALTTAGAVVGLDV